jgi:6-pyruvoyltetrahydropterin/6-carboxytetrahydropterin synthase
VEIFKTFTFEAAHSLPRVPPGHKCSRLHGHSYSVTVHVSGPVSQATGWVMDFADVSAAVRPILDRLDHQCLNDIDGLQNSTCENLARWIWERLKPGLPSLAKIVIHETDNSGCVYAGEV